MLTDKYITSWWAYSRGKLAYICRNFPSKVGVGVISVECGTQNSLGIMVYNSLLNTLIIRIEKHLQCEKLLGLAEGNTKKRRNKKSGESITPIRYNVIHMYIFARLFSLIISLVVFHAIWWFSKPLANPSNLSLVVGFNSLYMHFRGQ